MARPSRKAVLRDAGAIADAMYPGTKKSIDGLYDSWSGHPSMQKAIRGLNLGDLSPGEFMREIITMFSGHTPAAAKAFQSTAITAGELFSKVYGLDAPLNSQLWAESFAGERITSLSKGSITSVNQYVSNALNDGAPLSRLKGDIKHIVHLDARFVNATTSRYKALRAQKLTPKQARTTQDRYVARAAAIKAEQIARTETQIALNHGRYQAMYAARAAGLLESDDRMVWIAAPSCCAQCATLDGTNADLDAGFEISAGAAYPPLHPNCRCTIGLA